MLCHSWPVGQHSHAHCGEGKQEVAFYCLLDLSKDYALVSNARVSVPW